MRNHLPDLAIALRLTAVLMVVTGIIYPLAVTGVAQAVLHQRANGSLVTHNGHLTGSSLIGQNFTSNRYFHGRPSATLNAGGTPAPYDAANSSASNLGPTNPALIAMVQANANAVRCQDGLPPGPPPVVAATPAATAGTHRAACAPVTQPHAQVPVDAVTSSGSGLDPDISVAYAELQVARVAAARHLPQVEVEQLVQRQTLGRQFRILGEPRVNVLDLNLALDALAASA